MARHILQIGREQFSAQRFHVVQGIRLLRNDFLPRRLGIGRIEKHQLPFGRVLIRGDQEFFAQIVHHHKGVVADFSNDLRKRLLLLGEVAEIQRIAALPLAPVGNRENGKPLVVGRRHRLKALRILLVFVNQFIGGLFRAKNVEVDLLKLVLRRKFVPRLRRVEPAVEESISRPAKAREFDPFQIVRENLPRGDLDHVPFLPVRSANGNSVRGVAAILGNVKRAQTRSPIRRKLVWVQQHFRRPLQPLLRVNHVLILQPVVLGKKKIVALAERRRVFRKVKELLQARLHLGPIRNLVQIRERDLVLRFHPLGRFRGIVILQPAIRIGDLCTVIVIHLVVLPRLRIVEPLGHRDGREHERGKYGQYEAQVQR